VSRVDLDKVILLVGDGFASLDQINVRGGNVRDRAAFSRTFAKSASGPIHTIALYAF
jgi:hypothetical protein